MGEVCPAVLICIGVRLNGICRRYISKAEQAGFTISGVRSVLPYSIDFMRKYSENMINKQSEVNWIQRTWKTKPTEMQRDATLKPWSLVGCKFDFRSYIYIYKYIYILSRATRYIECF